MLVEYLKAIGANSDTMTFVIIGVMGLAWLYGRLGLQGRLQLTAAFVTGLSFGVSFYMVEVAMPTTPQQWFLAVLTGVLTGLMPSGFYEAIKSAAKNKPAAWLPGEIDPPPDL